jgi:hypothetical protein
MSSNIFHKIQEPIPLFLSTVVIAPISRIILLIHFYMYKTRGIKYFSSLLNTVILFTGLIPYNKELYWQLSHY